MAAPSAGFWQRRGALGLYELLLTWWRHRVSFLISVAITLGSMTLYYFTFFGEHPTPMFQFLQRVEYNTLDTRFRSRPLKKTPPDPRIVIVEIDQQSQEVLGKWPFSRSNFATMLDALREDGAKVVAFDVTFDKPDRTADPVRALWAKIESNKQHGERIDPKFEAEVKTLASEFDADTKFSKSIDNFGAVVLGNFFLTKDQLNGIDPGTLDQYAELIEWFSIGRQSNNPQAGKQDFANMVRQYEDENLVFDANVENIPILADPEKVKKTTIGYFNVPSDADGVVRRSLLVMP